MGAGGRQFNSNGGRVPGSENTILAEPIIAARLMLAAGLGAAIGLERERRDRARGGARPHPAAARVHHRYA
jgi:hypothetical protein